MNKINTSSTDDLPELWSPTTTIWGSDISSLTPHSRSLSITPNKLTRSLLSKPAVVPIAEGFSSRAGDGGCESKGGGVDINVVSVSEHVEDIWNDKVDYQRKRCYSQHRKSNALYTNSKITPVR